MFHQSFDWETQFEGDVGECNPEFGDELIIQQCKNQIYFPEFSIGFGSESYFQVFKRNIGFYRHLGQIKVQRY